MPIDPKQMRVSKDARGEPKHSALRTRVAASTKQSKAYRLSETDIGHRLHSGEIVFVEFWRLMLICLEVTLPNLDRGETFRAADLVSPALWDLLYRNERHRMGRCLHSYSRDPGARIRRVSKEGASPFEYCLA